jgi:pimeloyl-ACP methyl ester carboxylesterase
MPNDCSNCRGSYVDLPPRPELRFADIPAGSQSRYRGDRFSYMEAGNSSAPPLVLLHGIGGNSLHWRLQCAGLADRFRVIAWNAPGYMFSDCLVAETPTGRDYADAVADFLASLDVGQFDVATNSFGTRVAQCFAYYHPGRIGRAVFTGAGVAAGSSVEERARTLDGRIQMIARGGPALSERVSPLLGSHASVHTVAIVQNTLRATDPQGFLQAARFVASGDMPSLGAELALPVLLIQGAEDRVNPLARNAALLVEKAAECPACRARRLRPPARGRGARARQ